MYKYSVVIITAYFLLPPPLTMEVRRCTPRQHGAPRSIRHDIRHAGKRQETGILTGTMGQCVSAIFIIDDLQRINLIIGRE